MKDAFVRAGFAPAEIPAAPAQAPVKKAVCTDAIGRRCAILVALMGADEALELLIGESEAPYGRARRESQINACIERAFATMKMGAARELREKYAHECGWSFRRAEDLNAEMQDCISALQSKAYDAWLEERTRASKAPKWPAMPAIDLEDQTQIDRYRADLEAWESDRTPAEIQALGYPGAYPLIGAFESARAEFQRARWKEEEEAGRAEIVAQYERGEGTFEALRYSHSSQNALRRTVRAWLEGYGEGDPPVGISWGNVPTSALGKMVFRAWEGASRRPDAAKDRAAIALASRLSPGKALLYFGEYSIRMEDGSPVIENLRLPAGVERTIREVSTVPSVDGWIHGEYLIPGKCFVPLQRLRSAKRGNLSVQHVIELYGRHETERWSRFLTDAWGNKLVIGVHDELSQHCDDLALFAGLYARDLIPDDAWWLHATAMRTEKGMRIVPSGMAAKTALICMTGGTSSHGRHGVSGANVAPHAQNKALAVSKFGASGGGGQTRSRLVAAVGEHPLLLDDGSGYRLDGDTLVYVPGLAAGRPGAPSPVKIQ